MVERRSIVALWKRAEAGVLVTLIGVQGSSYRQPGARLLIVSAPAGYAGTISGGCLEAEVMRKGAWIIRNGAAIEHYSMALDDLAEVPFGLGCGGAVDLLFEPTNTAEGDALLEAMQRSLDGLKSVILTFLPRNGLPLRRVVVEDDAVRFASAGVRADDLAAAHSPTVLEGREDVFWERLDPPQRLLVLGAGDDAKPLVALAAQMGWSVTVADGRRQLAQEERFPGAEAVLALRGSDLSQLAVGPEDALVLMTHSYTQDRELLAKILPLAPRYLGLLGSRHRSSLLIAEVSEELGWTVDACCARISAPIGLNLGGDGPEAIALAVVAEVQTVRHGKATLQQRLTPAMVAAQIEKGGSSLYLKQCMLETP